MNWTRRRWVQAVGAGTSLLSLGSWAAGVGAPAAPGAVRTIRWPDLVPAGWDPAQQFAHRKVDRIKEGDEKEQALMREMRELWDQAPTRDELNGARLRLPGYVVPLEQARGKVSEFLLVPYFGACIHSPPPPANQIVLVALAQPREMRSMDTVWVTGVMRVQRAESAMGMSGYKLEQAKAEPYVAPRG
ncbi:DUF3299 domain-containing protein [Ideonella sp.]|uniref:DUF3299 domain-containing protein n=1 Tax=Ideonella sp. TaxID=1929293 RepID=UPI003BB52F32